MEKKLLGITNIDFDINDQILSTWQIFYERHEYKLSVDFEKAYDSFKRKVVHNILIKFGIHMKLVWLSKIYLNESSYR
jgi:hypothetical protein